MSQDPQDPQQVPQSQSFLDRFFLGIETSVTSHPWKVIILATVIAALSVWVTIAKLTFKTGRGDLVSKELPYVQRHEQYRAEFDDFDGMTIVVEADDPDAMKKFAAALAERLQNQSNYFSQVFYKIDTSYFKNKALLYLSQNELSDLEEKLTSRKQFLDDVNASPGLNQLLRSINLEISSGMVETLLSNFLGQDEDNEAEQEVKDDTEDLALLTSLLTGMKNRLQGDEDYHSPWRSLFSKQGNSTLKEEGYFVSDDGRLMFLLVNLNEDETSFTGYKDAIEFARKLIAETLVDFPTIQVGVTGEDVIASDEMVTTQSDVQLATLLALTGVSLLFILAFRGVVKPLLAIYCLVIALCWSMGFTTVTVGHLNILSVVFTTILIGLGIDFGIHILERFREEKRAGHDTAEALQITVQGTGRGNFAGAITTAMAFGAMVLTDFIGIAELGWIAGTGILICMLAMILLLPALITVEEKWRHSDDVAVTNESPETSRLENIFDHYKLIIGLSTALVLVASIAIKDVAFDYNILHLQAKGTEAVKYEMKILDSAHRSAWSTAVITDSFEDARKMEKALLALAEVAEVESIVSVFPEDQSEKIIRMQSLSPLLNDLEMEPEDTIFSLPSIVRTMKKIRFKLQGREGKEDDAVKLTGDLAQEVLQAIKNQDEKIAKQRLSDYSKLLFVDYRDKMQILKSNADPTPVVIDELPEELRNRYISDKGRYLLLVRSAIDIWDIDQRNRFLRKIREIDPNVAGNAIHMFESTRLMKEGYINGGLYALVAIVLFVIYQFRNPRTVLLVFLPVAVGGIWTIGLMDLFNIRFNLANLVILPLILGIGIVNGIHIIHRYREEADKNITVLSKSTGQAVILSSLTTMIGFGSMMVADHQGVFSLGLILTIGVGCCLVASITFLPAVLKLCTAKGWQL